MSGKAVTAGELVGWLGELPSDMEVYLRVGDELLEVIDLENGEGDSAFAKTRRRHWVSAGGFVVLVGEAFSVSPAFESQEVEQPARPGA